jgi:hypothetical protein
VGHFAVNAARRTRRSASRLLELVLLDADSDEPIVIHAMPLG